MIWEQNPEALNIYQELKVCDKAQRVDMQGIEGRISNLKSGVAKLKNTLQAAKKGNESTGVTGDRDPLASIMDEFIEEADPKIQQLENFVKQVWHIHCPTVYTCTLGRMNGLRRSSS